MKSITGKIESCQIKKEGITNKRPWKIFDIAINGEHFSTFDAKFAEHIGQEGTYEYEEKNSPDGQYVNKTLSKYPETVVNTVPSAPITNGDTTSVIRGLGILRGDIQKLEQSLNEKLDRLALAVEAMSKSPNPNLPMPSGPEGPSGPTPEYTNEANNSTDDIPIIN